MFSLILYTVCPHRILLCFYYLLVFPKKILLWQSDISWTHFWLCLSPHLQQMQLRWTMQSLLLLSWKKREAISMVRSFMLYQKCGFFPKHRQNINFSGKLWLQWHERMKENYWLKLKTTSNNRLAFISSLQCLDKSSGLLSVIFNSNKYCLRACIYRLKSFISRLTLNKPPRMRNKLFHKPMQA